MTRIAAIYALTLLLSGTVFAKEDSLSCKVIDDGIEKIQCTFVTTRKDTARETLFHWHSESHPQDDRERTIMLPANHGSVYDYRYLRGRAQGIWRVTVILTESGGHETSVSHHFLLEGSRIVNEDSK